MKRFIIIVGLLSILVVAAYPVTVIILRIKYYLILSHQVMNPLQSKPTDSEANIDSERAITYAVKRFIVDNCSDGSLDTKECQRIISLCKIDAECFQMVKGYQQAYRTVDYYTQILQKGTYTPTPQTFLEAALWYKAEYPFTYKDEMERQNLEFKKQLESSKKQKLNEQY